MTTETSVIYIVSSLNKVHILKAIHRVPFHHVTIPWFRITKNPATLNLVTMFNEMVSLGDTDISLHIPILSESKLKIL